MGGAGVNRVFFITGLPRTRTCWLANLFTTERQFCHHDLLGCVDDIPGLLREMTAHPGKAVGDSDSGLWLVRAWFKARWPAAPWVFVRRDFNSAWESLVRFVTGRPWADRIPVDAAARDNLMRAYYRALPELLSDSKCMVVDFSELETAATLQRMALHLGLAPLDNRRLALLQTLKMEPFQTKHPFKVNSELVKELWPLAQE